MQVHDQLYINGRWAAPKGGKFIDVINASTEEVMGRVPEGSEEDVNAAAARAAFGLYARMLGSFAFEEKVGNSLILRESVGGFKQSGNGRELGRFGLEEFLEYKSLQLKPEAKA